MNIQKFELRKGNCKKCCFGCFAHCTAGKVDEIRKIVKDKLGDCGNDCCYYYPKDLSKELRNFKGKFNRQNVNIDTYIAPYKFSSNNRANIIFF